MFSRPEVVVLPVAGLSTRNLPATKAMHKGFLCLNNLPIIQYAVDACAEAVVKEVIFVYSDETNRSMYEHYFTPNKPLEERLLRHDKLELWEALKRTVPAGMKFSFACQYEPKGNGHAILCAKELIGKRDFMVMWVDDVYVCRGQGILSQLLDVYERFGGMVENVIKFPRDQLSRYGVLAGTHQEGNVITATGVVEKPKMEEAQRLQTALRKAYGVKPLWQQYQEALERLTELKNRLREEEAALGRCLLRSGALFVVGVCAAAVGMALGL